jgi:hypothetical protein
MQRTAQFDLALDVHDAAVADTHPRRNAAWPAEGKLAELHHR